MSEPAIEIRTVAGPDGLRAALRIRVRVFVDEQGVSLAGEIDGLDPEATHLLALVDGHAVGTLRWRVICGGARARIERVAVLAACRGRGVALAMMRFLLARLDAEPTLRDTILSAQTDVRAFYERLGYRAEGEIYQDEGIPHIKMRRPRIDT